jgi:hypothetical protein
VTASNYEAIRKENVVLYGTRIDEYGPILLSHQYADRSHFIYELLQNAEDALARRQAWGGSRAVTFELSDAQLRVSNYGTPFTDADVQGICGIAMTTKDITSIGRFGIGFKSVYAFTDHPEIHSGDEHFAIESYVWPTAIAPAETRPDETFFVFPFSDAGAHDDIASGLQKVGVRTLLFLRQIEEISWSVEGGSSGRYLRDKPKEMGKGVRRVTLMGEEQGKPVTEETWTVFSREATTDKGEVAGHVEIAFLMTQADESGHRSIQAVSDSPLVVSFPTAVPTYLGFLTQGPYRTTPSRDNVPVDDPWNRHLVQETAVLLVEALRWLRDHDMLDTAVLECLPLDPARFSEGSMFGPLFEVVRDALIKEPLLPRFGGGYVAAGQAKLARTQELRDLLSPGQLGALYGIAGELHWLTGDISQDRTPSLRQYLLYELDVDEVTPDAIVSKLDKAFLESQSDDWIVHLYEFLNGQPALLRQGKLAGLPIIRLEDGTHVAAGLRDGQPTAFLPGDSDTDFPTVRRAVCVTEAAREFLTSLGLAEVDPVDVVLQKVVPRYACSDVDVSDDQYEQDMRRILAAWHTDSSSRREKLRSALSEAYFVRTRECATNEVRWTRPGDAYFATNGLKELFAGVPGVFLVDDSCVCLQKPDGVEMLGDCGVAERLRPVSCEPHFGYKELLDIRRAAGHERSTEDVFHDWFLMGLRELLSALSSLDRDAGATRAELLWNALCDVESHGDLLTHRGTYKWKYYYSRYTHPFDAAYVKQLNDAAWVPNEHGDLQEPAKVPFGTTGWSENEYLLSIIHFMPAVVEASSEVDGVELKVLDLLKRARLTTVEALVAALPAAVLARLGIKDQPNSIEAGNVQAALEKLGIVAPTPVAASSFDIERSGAGRDGAAAGAGTAGAPRPHTDMASSGPASSWMESSGEGGGKRTPGSTGGRPFVSYVGVQPDDEDADPDGLDQQTRMALEEKAIALIVGVEPVLHRTPAGNPGYDLFEASEDGQTVRWVEVKAMAGDLHGRPVGLSRTQFDWAREHGDAYWLYIVEHADSPNAADIVRIQDPAGKARTFTFDHGWLSVAQVSEPANPDEGRQP